MNKELSILADKLKKYIRDVLRKKGLVDSGKLVNSISVTANFTKGKISFEIEAEDYFEYLDNKYKIMNEVYSDQSWNRDLEDGLYKILELSIEENIK